MKSPERQLVSVWFEKKRKEKIVIEVRLHFSELNNSQTSNTEISDDRQIQEESQHIFSSSGGK